ncbi:hypothetical protein Q3G72_006301 [Acer saccharum]|nr:hypothetical protein Q3G72_006301 [Acer saccharum]
MFMDEKLILVSWASPDDPARGEFSFQKKEKQYIIKKEKSTYRWKSGVSGDFISDDILPTVSSLLLNASRNGNYSRNKATSSSSSETNTNMRLVMNSNGTLQYFIQVNEADLWDLSWSEPQDLCNVFRACGSSASCNIKNNKLMCECLPGFEASSPDKWKSGVFSEGCRRTMPICRNKVENFVPLNVSKVGKTDMNFWANNESECKEKCLKGCVCQAYSFKMPENSQLRGVANKTCWIWSDDLNNIQLDDTDGRHVIYLRVQPNISAPGADSSPWNLTWWEPRDQCIEFRACGDYAICNENNRPRGRCLPGFEPVLPNHWNPGENSEGCRIKMPLCSSKEKALNFRLLKVIKVVKPEENFKTNSEK